MKKRQVIMTTLAAAMVAPTVAGTAVTVNALENEQKTSILFLAIHTRDNKVSNVLEYTIKDLDTGETFESTPGMPGVPGVINIHNLNVGHRYSITPKDSSKEIIKFLGSDKAEHSENVFYCVDKNCDPNMCGGGALAFDKDGNTTLTDIYVDTKIETEKEEKKKMNSPIALHDEKNAFSDVTDFVITDITTGESFENHTDIPGMIFFENLIVGHKYSFAPKDADKQILKIGADDKKTYTVNEFLCEEIEGNVLLSFENNGKKILADIYTGEKTEKDDTDKDPAETPDDKTAATLEQLKINVTINGKPISQDEKIYVSFINWDEFDLPNTLYSTNLDKNGQATFNQFSPNSRYEIRLGGTNVKFDREFVRFTTDEDGKINAIDEKSIDKDFNGTIDFKSYEKTSTETKTFPVTIQAVFEDGTPAEGVTFTANTISPRLSSYKDTTTGKDGFATVELEGQEGGREYSFCVAKNAQFMWLGNPGSIQFTIDENGNIKINNTKPNKFGDKVFIVTKEDQTYLLPLFRETLEKAEKMYASDKYTAESKAELEKAIGNAKEEGAKKETIPPYIKECINLMNKAMENLEEKTTLDKINVQVLKNGKPIAESDDSYVDLIQWDRFGIPNTLEREHTDKDGEVTFKNLDPNSSYEVRMGNRNVKFDRDFIRFTTDKNGRICKIDGKDIEKDSTGLVTFNALDKSDTNTKTFPIKVRAVFEDGTPAEGVTFTANTLTPRMASYRNGITDKDGYATVELEGQEGGRDYSFCVAKNAQFMWQGNPGSIEFTVDENGNVSVNNRKPNKFGNTTFIVRKEDQRHLYDEFKETLKEAEEKYASDRYTDESKERLGFVLDSAREEDAKPETLPQYVKGFTDHLKDAMKLLVEKNSGHSSSRRSSRSSSSSSSVSTPVEKKDEVTKKEINEKITYNRVAGSNRVATSVSVSKKYYKKADTVILANAANYADALAASSFASAVKAPILLVDNSQLNGDITSEIERLGAKNVVIVGGNSSISDNVKKNLGGKNVERVAGANRFETSQKLAEKAMENGYKDSMIVVDGKNFPDALSASSLLKKHKGAVLLVDESASGLKNVEFAKQKHLGKNIIIGGEGSVSKNIEGKLDSTKRIAGKDRYETSRKIAEEVLEKNNNIFVATGNGFADALTVGPVLSQNNASLVLVNKGNDNLAGLKNKFEPNSITAIGGINSIAESVMNNLKK